MICHICRYITIYNEDQEGLMKEPKRSPMPMKTTRCTDAISLAAATCARMAQLGRFAEVCTVKASEARKEHR